MKVNEFPSINFTIPFQISSGSWKYDNNTLGLYLKLCTWLNRDVSQLSLRSHYTIYAGQLLQIDRKFDAGKIRQNLTTNPFSLYNLAQEKNL